MCHLPRFLFEIYINNFNHSYGSQPVFDNGQQMALKSVHDRYNLRTKNIIFTSAAAVKLSNSLWKARRK
jgi:hypothetical protein